MNVSPFSKQGGPERKTESYSTSPTLFLKYWSRWTPTCNINKTWRVAKLRSLCSIPPRTDLNTFASTFRNAYRPSRKSSKVRSFEWAAFPECSSIRVHARITVTSEAAPRACAVRPRDDVNPMGQRNLRTRAMLVSEDHSIASGSFSSSLGLIFTCIPVRLSKARPVKDRRMGYPKF